MYTHKVSIKFPFKPDPETISLKIYWQIDRFIFITIVSNNMRVYLFILIIQSLVYSI